MSLRIEPGKFLILGIFIFTSVSAAVPGYPEDVVKIEYLSSGDNSLQPSLFYSPPIEETPVPLLVALHTWSSGYNQAGGEVNYAKWCIKAGWCFIHPHFRGPNYTNQAMGSDLVVQDILSSIEYAKAKANIDENRIYCIGVSGGGHASLLMAGRAPDIWAGVSAWCGISDIAKWHQECEGTKFKRYAGHIEQALGASPGSSPEITADAMHRSPVRWLANSAEVPLDINHGIHDGRSGSVPFTHSLDAWNRIVPGDQRITQGNISEFYKTQKCPEPFPCDDHLYGKRQPKFRKIHNQTRLTIFEGGHEIIHHAALNWLAHQRKGQPVIWEIEKASSFLPQKDAAESGK